MAVITLLGQVLPPKLLECLWKSGSNWFCLLCVFFLLPALVPCPKWDCVLTVVWWSACVDICVLLRLRQPSHHFPSCGCPRSSVRLWHGGALTGTSTWLGLGDRHVIVGIPHGCMAVRSLGCFWQSAWVSTNHSHQGLSWTSLGPPKPPQFLDWIYSQVLATRDSSAKLWHGVSVLCSSLIEEAGGRKPLDTPLSTLFGDKASTYTLPHEWSLSILPVPVVLQAAKGACLPCIGPRTGTPSLWLNPPLPLSTCAISFFPLSPPRGKSWPNACLSILPN